MQSTQDGMERQDEISKSEEATYLNFSLSVCLHRLIFNIQRGDTRNIIIISCTKIKRF